MSSIHGTGDAAAGSGDAVADPGDAAGDGGLRRGLTARHIRFMALGSAIGTGLFMGSSGAIQTAGPAVLLAYVIGGAAVFIVMRALGEMVVRHPVSGSFGQYASRYIHPFAGFLVGWSFAFEMFLVAVFDATAIGLYMRFWFPEVSQWVWVLAVVCCIAAINLVGVKVLGELEFWFALIKIAAIVVLIAAGVGVILFGFGVADHDRMGVQNLVDHGGFMPHGVWGLLASFTIVMFAFGGIEIIGVTAGEAQDPKRVLPKAINSVPIRILLFYVLTLGVIMCIQPWTEITGETSPFVSLFESLGFRAAAAVFNVVLITAALSAMNADIFGAGRMLHGLAEQGPHEGRDPPGSPPAERVPGAAVAGRLMAHSGIHRLRHRDGRDRAGVAARARGGARLGAAPRGLLPPLRARRGPCGVPARRHDAADRGRQPAECTAARETGGVKRPVRLAVSACNIERSLFHVR